MATDGSAPNSHGFFLAGAVNNPRASWLDYLGLSDIDEWTLDDLRGSVAGLVTPAVPATDQAKAENIITIADFKDYLHRIGEPYRFLAMNGSSSNQPMLSSKTGIAEELPTEAQLSMIPGVCFDEGFDLTQPDTFNVFSPVDQPHTTMMTLEKLTHQLDQVELKLLHEVSTKSEGFFEALNSYENLTREVATGCQQIESLRERMRTLEKNLVLKSMRLPRIARRRVHTALLLNKLRLVHAVWRTQPTIQQLLTSRDFPSALELITSSQQLLSTELAGVSSLGTLQASLEQTRKLIKDMMSKDLLLLALGYDPDEPPTQPTEVLASDMEIKFIPLAAGLLRLGVLHDALLALEEQLKKDLRLLVKRRLQDDLASKPELTSGETGVEQATSEIEPHATSGTEGNGGKGARTVNTQLRELSVERFEEIMSGIALPVLVLLRRTAVIDGAIKKVIAGAGVPLKAPTDEMLPGNSAESVHAQRVEKQSTGMVQRVCELAHDRFARLLKTRKEVHARLPLMDFVHMSKGIHEFVNDVQHLSGHSYDALSGELQAHAQAFMQTTHESSMHKLEAIVEVEQWKQVDVAPEFQQIIDSFARNQVPQIHEADLLRLRDLDLSDSSSASKDLIIDGSGFKVVGSGLLLLNMVAYYMQCVALIQSVSAQVAHLLPALLKLFHTQAYKQVLQAGALRPDSAGLKSIAAKHLALSSNSLGLVLALFPHLKAIMAAYLPDGQRALLREMDTAVSDYETHQQQLFAKFVSILEDRRRGHIGNLREALAPSEDRRRPETSANMKAVVKDIVSMHKQLQPLLTRTQLHAVFDQVLTAFDSGLLEAYSSIDSTPLYSRQCIVQDVHYLRQEVSKLHLNLSQGCCPKLVQFGMSLPIQ